MSDTMDIYAKQALEECNSDTHTVRRGGKCGRPFWNINSTQFTFVPQFSFPAIPCTKRYVYTATDSEGKTYTFEDSTTTAPLTPIWKDLAVGLVTLRVDAIHPSGKIYPTGLRSFYKMSPFPGRSALPPRARSYRECARLAFRYVFEDPTTRYWLDHGKPDPDYYHNVYPSKTISSIINAMLAYASLEPSNAEDARHLAINAADYLISLTYGEGYALKGLPPTYSFLGLNKEIVDANAPAADKRQHQLMVIYPATVGQAYLWLEKVTGDIKYFEAAQKIAEFYSANVLPNGSWYLLMDAKTGEVESNNCSVHFGPLNFLNAYYQRTGDERFHTLERNYYNYLVKTCLENYNWEGQFEDVVLADYYSNLTHFSADQMIGYISKNLSDDPAMMKEAEEMMRFVEDQFIVWDKHADWGFNLRENDYQRREDAHWFAPAGLEQYRWYVPIDGSTATIMRAFLDLYSATKDPLLLEKAKALGDSITRMQNPESGVIPTHWMAKDCAENLFNFWINCHIGTAFQMLHLATLLGEE